MSIVVVDKKRPGPPEILPPMVDNHEICQKCPGYCCHRFWLSFTKEELKKSIKDGKFKDSKKAAEFVLKYFRRLPRRDRPELENWYCRAYTCKKFDGKLGRCKAYGRRPELCRRYFCSMKPGEIPSGMQDSVEWGKKVLARRAHEEKKK